MDDEFYDDVIWPFIKLNKDRNVDHIRLIIDSPGGVCTTGYQLITLIRNASKPVIAEAVRAISMGFMILTQCHYRVAHVSADLMAHDPWSVHWGNEDEIDRQLISLKHLSTLGRQLLLSRTKITAKLLDAHKGKDWWMTPQTALHYNVIDEIAPLDYVVPPGKPGV